MTRGFAEGAYPPCSVGGKPMPSPGMQMDRPGWHKP